MIMVKISIGDRSAQAGRQADCATSALCSSSPSALPAPPQSSPGAMLSTASSHTRVHTLSTLYISGA